MRKDQKVIVKRCACAINRWLGLTRPNARSCRKRNEIRQDERDRFDTFTQRARNVLALAQEEAQRLHHPYLGTELLLLGLVREGEGVVGTVLRSLEVERDQVRQAVEGRIGRGEQVVLGEMRLTPRAKRVLELAALDADYLHHDYLGTEHLLIGLLQEGEGIGAQVLKSFGLSVQQVRAKTMERLYEA